jgi:hypothetical protein
MFKKMRLILFAFVSVITLSGCLAAKDIGIEQPMVTTDPSVSQPLENFNQLTAEERKAAAGDGDKSSSAPSNPYNEDLAMKHWKYNRDSGQYSTNTGDQSQAGDGNNQAASTDSKATKQGTSSGRNYSSDNGDYKPAVIQLLTEEDIQLAVNQLVKQGYLAGTKVTESDFRAALTKYQNAQNLNPSGLLDGDTLTRIKNPDTALPEK